MRARRALASSVLLALVPCAVLRCSRSPEPDTDPGYRPTSVDGLAAAAETPAHAAGMTEQEYRDVHIHLAHELCDKAYERINVINGRPPTDPNPGARMQLGACIMQGNNAWYKCVLGAQKPEDLAICNKRFMLPPR